MLKNVSAKNGATQQTVTTAYGTDGRISGAGFLHGGQEQLFTYGYLQGSHLLQTLTKPNGMTLTQSYEQHRDLLTQMDYKRGNTLVARRSYQYDSLGRPTSRTLARQGATRNDVFTYNDRSESPRRLVGGLDKTADGVRRVSLWCSYSPAKQGEGTMGCARSKPRSAFAPQGRAGNGVPASQFYDLTTFVQKN